MRNMWIFAMAVLAVCSCGGASDTPSSVPDDPAGLSVELADETSARLSWTAGADPAGWWVFLRKETDAFHIQPLNYDAPLSAGARSYTFEGLTPGSSYDFGVQALGGSGNSSVVYAPRFTVPVPEVPVPPVTVTVDASTRKVTFTGTSTRGEDLSIGLAPVSNNKTVQIDTYAVGGESFQSYTDWVGPYHMQASGSPGGNWGFTGGWHASSGGADGTPTASTVSFAVTVDGKPVSAGTHTGEKEAACQVVNRVEAGNTKFGDAKRFVLEETVTYTFREGRLYVELEAAALEDLTVYIYYGMQIANGFCTRFSFTTGDGTTQTVTQATAQQVDLIKGKVREMTGYSSGGHEVVAHMDEEGLGDFSLATPSYSALTQFYGTGNGKGYYMLIGDKDASSKSYTFRSGTTIHWSGYYEFR